jgi:glycogen operon protein
VRREHPVFRRQRFLQGTDVTGSGLPDVWWFRPDGRKMTQKDWNRGDAHSLGVFLNGEAILDETPHGQPIVDDSFLLLFNAGSEAVTFTLPTRRFGARWEVELATGDGAPEGPVAARTAVTVQEQSLLLLRRA